MKTTTDTKATAHNARDRFRTEDYAGAAQEVAAIAFRTLTLVRLGKASPSVAADLLRRISAAQGRDLPALLDLGLLRTADELASVR